MVIEKFNGLESAQKMGVVSSVSDMATFLKQPNFPFASKNSIDRNRLKKFMQVGIDVKLMHTDFDGCGFFGFGDMATFQKWPNFPFGAWTIVHGHRKI